MKKTSLFNFETESCSARGYEVKTERLFAIHYIKTIINRPKCFTAGKVKSLPLKCDQCNHINLKFGKRKSVTLF